MHLPCNSGLLQAARRRVPSLLAAFEDSEELMPLYKMLAGHDVNQVGWLSGFEPARSLFFEWG